MYSPLAMLYATYVMKPIEDGGRTIESVPAAIRDQVQEILDDVKKQEDNK